MYIDSPECRVLIRKIQDTDFAATAAIINDAAQAYRGVIPADRWREPYMPDDELAHEIADGVQFWGAEQDGCLLGVMGLQDKGEVTLIRHAYVLPSAQGRGIGTRLLRQVAELTSKPILVGTWAAAGWAIAFYRRRGFILVPPQDKDMLLRQYWSIPERQAATSVVLADSRWTETQNGLAED
jgi:GNAT superfamily N-acetyltransferase